MSFLPSSFNNTMYTTTQPQPFQNFVSLYVLLSCKKTNLEQWYQYWLWSNWWADFKIGSSMFSSWLLIPNPDTAYPPKWWAGWFPCLTISNFLTHILKNHSLVTIAMSTHYPKQTFYRQSYTSWESCFDMKKAHERIWRNQILIEI